MLVSGIMIATTLGNSWSELLTSGGERGRQEDGKKERGPRLLV
jgi:hypothetical protein